MDIPVEKQLPDSRSKHLSEKKTIYFVNPLSGSNVAGLTECIDLLGYRYLCPNLSLPTLAAMVDQTKFNVVICDENVDTVDFDLPCDIVGLTIYHYQRERTFEIAREFKKRGRLVIVGGPYATQNLQNGHPLFDVVFCGEAERTWLQFLNDYLKGNHCALYLEREHPDITSLPVPRFDLMHNDRYLLGAIQVGRGCPYMCDFCTCTVLYGRSMRYKTNGQVIAELEQLHRLGYRSIFLLDDNLVGDRKRAGEIIGAIRDWNESKAQPVMFSTSASIDIATQSDLGRLFAEAMITNVFVGIETPSQESLKGAGKFQNLKSDPRQDVEALHRLGIDVAAGIMVGFDEDDVSIFRRQVSFLQELSIPVCFAGMVLAPDGTELKERLIREGRYLGSSDIRDHTKETNVAPKLMSVEKLRQGYFWMMNQLYDEDNFIRRVRGALDRYPDPSPLASRYKPREVRSPLKFVSVIFHLICYYVGGGRALFTMFLKYIPLIIKHRKHAATAIYWLIAYKHFREMLIERGVFKKVPPPDEVDNVKSPVVEVQTTVRPKNRPIPWYARIGLVISIGALQLLVFYITYYLYKVIPYPFYLDLETWVDQAIPYIDWSWVIYYFGFVYITVWGAAGIWTMSRWRLRRTVWAYVTLVLTGGGLHLLLPSDSPWPLVANLSAAQNGFKTTYGIEPLAGFPSMHAAMTVLAAFISVYEFRSKISRVASMLLAALVCISIVTAREHWFIDVPAGIILGLGFGWIWRRFAQNSLPDEIDQDKFAAETRVTQETR